MDKRKSSPIDDVLCMQVQQPHGNFRCIKDGPLRLEPWYAHVVDVKLKISTIHQR